MGIFRCNQIEFEIQVKATCPQKTRYNLIYNTIDQSLFQSEINLMSYGYTVFQVEFE
jgi:hypothetical protein